MEEAVTIPEEEMVTDREVVAAAAGTTEATREGEDPEGTSLLRDTRGSAESVKERI